MLRSSSSKRTDRTSSKPSPGCVTWNRSKNLKRKRGVQVCINHTFKLYLLQTSSPDSGLRVGCADLCCTRCMHSSKGIRSCNAMIRTLGPGLELTLDHSMAIQECNHLNPHISRARRIHVERCRASKLHLGGRWKRVSRGYDLIHNSQPRYLSIMTLFPRDSASLAPLSHAPRSPRES